MSDLIKYFLPTMYKDDAQANIIIGAFKDSKDRLKSFIIEAFNQCCVSLATWGLEDWEKELAITPPENASIELRRALVKAKLMRPPIMTPAQIQAIANCFTPNKDAKVIDPVAPYVFKIVLPTIVEWLNEMADAIDEAKPAHLAYTIEANLLPPEDESNRLNLFYGLYEYEAGTMGVAPAMVTESRILNTYGLIEQVGGAETVRSALPVESRLDIGLNMFIFETGVMTIRMKGAST